MDLRASGSDQARSQRKHDDRGGQPPRDPFDLNRAPKLLPGRIGQPEPDPSVEFPRGNLEQKCSRQPQQRRLSFAPHLEMIVEGVGDAGIFGLINTDPNRHVVVVE